MTLDNSDRLRVEDARGLTRELGPPSLAPDHTRLAGSRSPAGEV